MTVNRQILLTETPQGKLAESHFKFFEGKVPEAKDGELLVRTKLISLDAANRAWMQGAKIKVKKDILEGIENTPKAPIGLPAGGNVGKRMVKIS